MIRPSGPRRFRSTRADRARRAAVLALFVPLQLGCSLKEGAQDGAEPAACVPSSAARQVAARSGVAHLLEALPAEQRAGLGFAHLDDLSRVELGTPYELWTTDATDSALVPTGEWRFPVTLDGAPRALLTVALVDGHWRAVNLGAAGLAKELDTLERQRAIGSGTSRALVRLPTVRADLVAFPAEGEDPRTASLEPLASARAAVGGPRSPLAVTSLLSWVRERRVVTPPTR